MKTSSPHLPSSEAQIHSRILSLLPPQWGTANGGCGQFTCNLCCSFLTQRKVSPHSSPAPAKGRFHRKQSSINFSHMSPSHKLQILMNSLCRSLRIHSGTGCSREWHPWAGGFSPMDSMGYRGTAVSPWSLPQPAKESLLECLEHFLLLLIYQPWCL